MVRKRTKRSSSHKRPTLSPQQAQLRRKERHPCWVALRQHVATMRTEPFGSPAWRAAATALHEPAVKLGLALNLRRLLQRTQGVLLNWETGQHTYQPSLQEGGAE
jgi:hypothetical protein